MSKLCHRQRFVRREDRYRREGGGIGSDAQSVFPERQAASSLLKRIRPTLARASNRAANWSTLDRCRTVSAADRVAQRVVEAGALCRPAGASGCSPGCDRAAGGQWRPIPASAGGAAMTGTRRCTYYDGQPRLRIDTLAGLADAIVLNEQVGAVGQTCLLRASMAGRIAFLPPLLEMSASKFKMFAHATRWRPAVMLVGDDDGMDRCPTGWRLAQRALRWARAVKPHAVGAELEHYDTAIMAAEMVRRVLVIKCSTATLPGWLVLTLPLRMPTLAIRPRRGIHQLTPDRSAMQ
jgi:hypothetical protein